MFVSFHTVRASPGLRRQTVKAGVFGEADGGTGYEEDQGWEDSLLCLYCLFSMFATLLAAMCERIHTVSIPSIPGRAEGSRLSPFYLKPF